MGNIIHVKDLDASIMFYQKIIGLKLNRRFEAGAGVEIAFLGTGETQVELIKLGENTSPIFGKDISLGFEVSSIEEFIKINEVKNYKGPIQPNSQIKFIYIQDPDGLNIQLIESIKK